MDFDPRDSDSRDDERFGAQRDRVGADGADTLDRDDDWRQPEASRDRDDDARSIGRGPGDARSSGKNARDRHDLHWVARNDAREHDHDVRDAFMRNLNLP